MSLLSNLCPSGKICHIFSIKADLGSQWRCTLCTSLANHQKVNNLIQKIWQFLDFSLRFVVPIYLVPLQMETQGVGRRQCNAAPNHGPAEENYQLGRRNRVRGRISKCELTVLDACSESSESHILVFCTFLFPQLAGLVKDAINGRYESYSKVNNDKSYPDLVAFVLILLNLSRW